MGEERREGGRESGRGREEREGKDGGGEGQEGRGGVEGEGGREGRGEWKGIERMGGESEGGLNRTKEQVEERKVVHEK